MILAVLKALAVPVTNERGPRYMERALAAFHQAHHDADPLTLIFTTHENRVGLFLEFPHRLGELVCGPVVAHYPNATLSDVDPSSLRRDDAWSMDLHLSPDLFPILRHGQFEDMLNGNFADPIGGILRAIAPEEGMAATVAIRLIPATARRRRVALNSLRLLDRIFFRRHPRLAEYYAEHVSRHRFHWIPWLLGLFARQTPPPHHTTLDTSTARTHDREEDLQAASAKIGGHLFEAHIRLIVQAPSFAKEQARDRLKQLAGAFGAFTQSRLATFHSGPMRRGSSHPHGRGMLLSHEEVATLFHPPTATVAAERMRSTEFRELEPPSQFYAGEEEGAATLGRVLFRSDTRRIGIDPEARRRHLYIVGATGAGKSTLLLNLIQQDMQAGRGLTVIDVHGDLAAAVVRSVPKSRTNDAIIFEAAGDRLPAFNPLACPDPARIDQVTSGVVSAFKKLYDSWGPRLENLLRYAVFAIVEQQGTLLDMLRLLADKAYRDLVVARISDDVVRSFWLNEFAHWTAQYRNEAVSSVTNKLMPFLTSRQLRAIVTGAGKHALDIRRVMDRGELLVVNLSRGLLGQDNATLLGSLLLTSIEQAALSRADIPEAERRDHFLYLDEFQSLVTPSTAIMLSESRKYRLALTLSHQLTRQLDEQTYHSVIGNCGTLLAFRVGVEDAELLAPAISQHPGQLAAADLCNLPNYTAYVRLLDPAGQPSRPFSLRTLPPAADLPDREAIVRKTAMRRFAPPVLTSHPTLAPVVQ